MADSQTLDRRGMDRRKFIGAAAGAAAAGATLAGPWSSSKKASAQGPSCNDENNPGYIPPYRNAQQTFNLPGSYWQSQAAWGTYALMFRQCGGRAWEPAGQNLGYYSNIANFGGAGPVANSMNMWAAAGSATRANGIRIVGDHGGPEANNLNNCNSGILKANRWQCESFGSGGGNPAFGAGATSTAQWNTLTAQVGSWQGSANTMNLYGLRFQHGFNLDDSGPFGELAPCQRFYRHFHAEGAGWIWNTGGIYDGHFTQEVYYNECDPALSYAQVDLAWMTDGLSLGRGGPGCGTGTYPAPSANQNLATTLNTADQSLNSGLEKLNTATEFPGGLRANVQFIPDIIERWQDKMPSWHTKDLATSGSGSPTMPSVPVGLGTTPGAPGDAVSPGNAISYPGNPAGTFFGSPSKYGEIPYAISQDTTPFYEVFSRLRNPACHYYIVEDDSATGTGNSPQYWPKVLAQAYYGMLGGLELDRSYIRANWPGGLCRSGQTNSSALPAYTPVNPTPANSFAGPLDPRLPDPTVAGAQAGYPGADNGTAPPQFLPGTSPNGPKVTTSSTGPAAQLRYPITYWTDPSKTTRLYEPFRPPASSGAPINCSPPVIIGSGLVGEQLKVSDPGQWQRRPGNTSYFCYRWLRNGMVIQYHGANGSPSVTCAQGELCSCCGEQGKKYLVQLADAGAEITCEVTCYNGTGSTAALTNGITAVGGNGPEAIQSAKVYVKKHKISAKSAVWSQTGDKTTTLQRSSSSTGPWTDVASPYSPSCPADDGMWFRTTSTISNNKGSATSSSDAEQYTFC